MNLKSLPYIWQDTIFWLTKTCFLTHAATTSKFLDAMVTSHTCVTKIIDNVRHAKNITIVGFKDGEFWKGQCSVNQSQLYVDHSINRVWGSLSFRSIFGKYQSLLYKEWQWACFTGHLINWWQQNNHKVSYNKMMHNLRNNCVGFGNVLYLLIKIYFLPFSFIPNSIKSRKHSYPFFTFLICLHFD